MAVEEGMANEVPQGRMITPAKDEAAGNQTIEDARQAGTVYTCEFSEEETRPPEMHGSLHYQEQTAAPGGAPQFLRYTELTSNQEG